MPRPQIARQFGGHPAHNGFKPNGRSMHQLEQVTLTADEFEALQLVDLEGMQQQGAGVMNISRQTQANILKKARYCVDCLSQGKEESPRHSCY
ncbi:DUF134 domain-containing protein [Aeromonas popoffii]|uniref:DUF134 domain-containing protein n=1 Tax=Aeromonas popoffii TaxID=70856 RepID=UPI0005A78F84|nr:DUF134 domain-containing protein [Aeromonas popoffii]